MDRSQAAELIEPELSNKPANRPYYQQTLRSWSPLLTPWRAVGGYLLIGLIFVPLGAVLWHDKDVVELRYQYDGDGSDGDDCKITTYKENLDCTITFDVEKDIPGPAYVYYELTNFYQNHATYVASVGSSQLLGSTSTSDIDDCDPLIYNGTLVLHPCGLIANTLFNDIFTVSSGQTMEETDIAWDSDVADKFVQPDGFVTTACEDEDGCVACLTDAGLTDSDGGTTFEGCGVTDSTAYYYPDEDTTQYLYETFPEVISPLDGVKNEHFIVWMRVSGLSSFRKLYGRIDDGLNEGDTLSFDVSNNFIVDYYDGTKSIIVSNTNDFGGRNLYWGQSLPSIGGVVLVLALLIAIKQLVWPRTMGDISKLLDDP
ncbi:conserved unknown protein [Ectocarpus siliculosus]|uniref:Uncharacterized protein n=1 Tax=Ectocarpus siliculosus TaxID=2880 RepID=D8LE53_ECTSI|nr:conserved unknown protein [Ectocarpus siliculosus]|eukprot:CBN74125.1 conserved unknown protein [Ectocarpus siliculosus]